MIVLFSTIATKAEPIEINESDVVSSPTNELHSKPVKRSRKSAHPSKTIQTTTESSLLNPLTTQSSIIPLEEPRTTSTSTDEEFSNLSLHFTRLDENESTISDEEETPVTYSNLSVKRPRLSYDKRLEANARERERVHNLTAAFEALRQAIPMYGDQPKLSRLSILRIACSYVLVLGSLNEIDFSEGQNAYTFNECFHMLSSTILNELKRKKSNQQQHNKND